MINLLNSDEKKQVFFWYKSSKFKVLTTTQGN